MTQIACNAVSINRNVATEGYFAEGDSAPRGLLLEMLLLGCHIGSGDKRFSPGKIDGVADKQLGNAVTRLQEHLEVRGRSTKAVRRRFGPMTKAALKERFGVDFDVVVEQLNARYSSPS